MAKSGGGALCGSWSWRRLGAVWNIGKWVILVVALAYLWNAGAASSARLSFSPEAYRELPLAVLFIFLATAGMGVRLHCLLRCLACPSSLWGQVKVALSGLLAQQIGSDAGFDAMRLFAAKAMGGKGSDIFAAVMTDRLLGLTTLTGIAAAGLALFRVGSGWWLPVLGMLAALAAIPLGFAGWHSMSEAGTAVWLRRLPGTGFAASVGGAIKAYRRRGRPLAALFILSLAAQFCALAALYHCGASLDAGIEPLEALVGGALAAFTGILPLPLAGLGVGEAAFGEAVLMLRGTGTVVEFAAVFLLRRLLLLFLGAASWLWLSLSKGVAAKDAAGRDGS